MLFSLFNFGYWIYVGQTGGDILLVRNTIINFSLAGLTITFCWDSIQMLSDDTITRYVEIAFSNISTSGLLSCKIRI